MPNFNATRVSLLTIVLSMMALPARAGEIRITGTPPNATAGKSYYWVPTVTGGNHATMTFSYVNAPSWSGKYRGSGAIIGTPTQSGVYSNIQIEAWDGENFGASAPFTITVTGGTAPPTSSTQLKISGTPEETIEVGQAYYFAPTVVAPAGANLTYSVKNKPSWATLKSSSGALTGTPTAPGETSSIILSVSDGAQSASLPAFSITADPAAASSNGTATLSWSAPTANTNGSPLTNLAGYVVRYGTSSSNLNSQVSVTTNQVEIESLSAGVWYFAVAAVNSLNVEGEFSQAVSRQIP
jgi:hypothetical protein